MYKQFALWALVVAGAGGAGEAIAMEQGEKKGEMYYNAAKEVVMILANTGKKSNEQVPSPNKTLFYKYPGGPLVSSSPEPYDNRSLLKKSRELCVYFCGGGRNV